MRAITSFFATLQKKGVIGYSGQLRSKNVRGLDVGPEAIRIYVEEKSPAWRIAPWNRIPKEINGIPTDVIEVGEILILAVDRTKRFDPIPAGVSVASTDVSAGTHTGIFPDKTDGTKVTMSNEHVYGGWGTKLGKDLVQPGPYDGGVAADRFAKVKRTTGIELFGTYTCDTAIGELTGEREVAEYWLLDDGTKFVPDGEDVAKIGDELWKIGRTSGSAPKGDAIDDNAVINVGDGSGAYSTFTHQILASPPILDPGDSGSATFKGSKLVGQGFAGSDQVSVHSHWSEVKKILETSTPPEDKYCMLPPIIRLLLRCPY